MSDTPVQGPHVRHERRDITVRYLVYTAGFMIVFALVMHLSLAALTAAVSDNDAIVQPPVVPNSVVPPAPRLQVDEVADLAEMRRQESLHLNGYGWIDRREQRVHIPIDRAMDSIVQNGLPKWNAPSAQKLEAPK